MKPVLQLALDFLNLQRALRVAREALQGGVDWLEAGTPLIKSEGLNSVRELRRLFPRTTIVADMKTMDVGRIETEAAAKAGANIVCVLAQASNSTIEECVKAGKNYGAKIEADLIGISEENIARRAKEVEGLGVDYIGVHLAIDEQMEGKDPFMRLRKVRKAVRIPTNAKNKAFFFSFFISFLIFYFFFVVSIHLFDTLTINIVVMLKSSTEVIRNMH